MFMRVNVGARIGPRPRRRPRAHGDIGMTARGEIRRAGEMTRVGTVLQREISLESGARSGASGNSYAR